MQQSVVIVGAGHAAGQLCARLRAEGFEGRVQLIGDEIHVPYQRPPLSKDFLAGKVDVERTYLRPASFYQEAKVELVLDTTVVAIDRSRREVSTSRGERIPYDELVLATGSRPRTLALPGAELEGVCYLRRIADAERIRDRLAPGMALTVVGGGYIGLEVAAVAADRGSTVTVVEMGPRALGRVAGSRVASFFQDLHRQHGVDVRTRCKARRLSGPGRVHAVELDDGTRVGADMVVIGVGVEPVTELASSADLAVDDGILVDAYGATTDPRIHACGDCSRHPSRLYGRNVRLESVHNAMAQARTVAANLCGKVARYDEVPWFWSDQYDVKLQIAGLAQGHDRTLVRGDPEQGRFSVFYLRDGALIAADTVNAPKDHLACRKLITAAARVAPERLTDASQPLPAP